MSVLLADAVAQMGRAGQVRVVASDLFGETVRNMEEGLVQNILYKDPAQQGYLAAGSWVISCCAGYSPRPASTTWKAV